MLASDSIGSVQVVHHLGADHGQHLNALSIPVVAGRWGVGATLQDFLQLCVIYKVDGAQTRNRI